MVRACNGATSRTLIRAAALILLLGLWSVSSTAESAPERIVSLAPHLTELAYDAGLGGQLVGVVAYSDYPPEARDLPAIGDAFRFDLEKLLQLDTQLALAWAGGTPNSVIERIRELGIEVVVISTRTLDDIPAALRTLAGYSHYPVQGEQAAKGLEQALQARRNRAPAAHGSAFYQVSERPLFTLGGRHVISEVMRLCGLENLFKSLDSEAAAVDLEAVLAGQPDWLIIGHEPIDPTRTQNARRFWTARGIDAERILVVDPTLLIRPTARILDGIDELCELTSNGDASP
ncbi:MAG: cobalamin-binding protein [Wenzhouxiangella sp.]